MCALVGLSQKYIVLCGPGSSVGIATELRAVRCWDRIPVGRDFSPVQTGPGAHSASRKMGTGSFPGLKSGRGVTLNPHPLLMPWAWKGRAIPLLPLWAVRRVQSLSACTWVHFASYNTVAKLCKLCSDNPSGLFLTSCGKLILIAGTEGTNTPRTSREHE